MDIVNGGVLNGRNDQVLRQYVRYLGTRVYLIISGEAFVSRVKLLCGGGRREASVMIRPLLVSFP